MARKLPEINSTSTADIAFMLLIFFLVTTTMDVDSGLPRRLPPLQEDPSTENVIKTRNVLVVLINKNNELMIGNKAAETSQLRERVKEFILNPLEDANLSDKKLKKNIPFFGNRMVSKGIVSLQNDKGTEFGKYLEVQNEIVAAFNELKESLAQQKWKMKYDELPKDKQLAIRKIYPLSISEAEPKNVGG